MTENRILQGRDGQVARLDLRDRRTRVVREHVIVPVFVDVTASTEDQLEGARIAQRVTRTEFLITTAGTDRGRSVAIVGACVIRHQGQQCRRDVRVSQVDIEGHTGRRRSQLGVNNVVGIDTATIELEMLIHFIRRKRRDVVAFLRQLKVVRRRIVVSVVRVTETHTTNLALLVHEEARAGVTDAIAVKRLNSSRVQAEVGGRGAAEAGARNVRRTTGDETVSGIAGARIPVGQRGECAIALEDGVTIGVAHRDDSVTATIVEIAAHRDGQVGDLTIKVTQRGFLRRGDINTFEVVFHDEVDDTGNSVRTVNGRSTTGHDVDRFDERGRDVVEVDNLRRAGADEAHAVDEDERTGRAEAAKADGCRTVTRVVRGRIERRNDLRQGVDEVFGVDRVHDSQLLSRHVRDRARRNRVGALDARTGYDDDVIVLRDSGGRDGQTADQRACHQASLQGLGSHS